MFGILGFVSFRASVIMFINIVALLFYCDTLADVSIRASVVLYVSVRALLLYCDTLAYLSIRASVVLYVSVKVLLFCCNTLAYVSYVSVRAGPACAEAYFSATTCLKTVRDLR